jgi:hypothetical protein
MQVNSRYEFYETLEFKPHHMAPTSDKSVAPKYRLYAVLVHSGASQGGHYYAYIRPSAKEWYKFDDETVTQVDEKEAIEQQYGGDATQLTGGARRTHATHACRSAPPARAPACRRTKRLGVCRHVQPQGARA